MRQTLGPKAQRFVGFLTLFIIGTDLFVVSPILPFIADQFAITAASTGMMVTLFSIMYACGAPLFGGFADRWGRKQMIIVGLAFFTVANLLTGLSTSFGLLLASRVLAGLAAACITPSIYAITGDVAPAERRASWLAIVNSGLLMALWAGAPLGSFLERMTSWRFVFFALSAVSLLLIPLNQVTWPKVKGVAIRIQAKGFAKVFSSVSVTACWGASVYGLYTYLGTGLITRNHFDGTQVAISLIVFGIGAMTGSLYGGRVSDQWGAKRVTSISMVGLVCSLGLVGLLFEKGAWVYPSLAIWSFLGYAYFPAFQARLAQSFHLNRGVALAWNSTALYVGMTIGSLLGSAIIDNWGFAYLPYGCVVLAVLGVVLNMQRIGETITEPATDTTVAS